MRKLINIGFVMSILLLSGCVSICKLNVKNGYGTGTYKPLKTVNIVANDPQPNYVFEAWIGDISGIGNDREKETTIFINQLSKDIEATYKNIDPNTTTTTTAETTTSTIETTSSTSMETSTTSSTTTAAPIVYTYIPGDKADKGPEIWKNFNGMDIRLSVDAIGDFAKAGIYYVKGSWYPLDDKVMPKNAATLQIAPDGGIIADAYDFISSKTGMKYHCEGYYVQKTTDGTYFRKGSHVEIPKEQCTETLRFMWATVK